jgi:hypothetical protein
MTHYALRRGREWICAPPDADPLAQYDNRVTRGTDKTRAWVTPSLGIAHDRQTMLRTMRGWATQIQAIKP